MPVCMYMPAPICVYVWAPTYYTHMYLRTLMYAPTPKYDSLAPAWTSVLRRTLPPAGDIASEITLSPQAEGGRRTWV